MPRLLTAIISLFLTLILVLFFLWPKYQKLREIQAEIKVKEVERKNQEDYISHLYELSEKLKEYQREILVIDSALPPRPDLPSLLNFLQKVSGQNGLIFKKLGSFSIALPKKPEVVPGLPQETKSPSEIKEISLDFEVSGSYSALKNFLSSLERSARLIKLESLSFSSEEGEITSFKLKIKTHSY